ncbi:hypothetical protein DFP72DRAFT_815091, partial [Ephemerocybe angulata]
KRHCNILRDNIQSITKPAICRVVKRIFCLIYNETHGVLKIFLEHVSGIRLALSFDVHTKRKTVTAFDLALKRSGHTLYGFGALIVPVPIPCFPILHYFLRSRRRIAATGRFAGEFLRTLCT